MKRRISLSLPVFYIVMWTIISFLFYFGVYRNNLTYSFRYRLVWQTLALKADKIQEYKDSIYSRYSYTDFMFSFKPLKVKYWYTEEEIEKYKLYLVDKVK